MLFKNPRSIVNWSFFCFACGIAVWIGSLVLVFITKSIIFDRVILMAGTTLLFGLVLLAKTFPNSSQIKKSFWLTLIPFIPICVAIPFGIFVSGIEVSANGAVAPINTPWFPLYAFFFGFYVIFSIILFFRNYRKLSDLARLKMKYLFFGAATFGITGFVFSAVLPFLGVFDLNFMGILGSIVFVTFTAYALVRHQLMDIRVVIQKSLIYATLLGVIVSLYLLSALHIGLIIPEHLSVMISAGLSVVVGIISVFLIEIYSKKRVEEKTSHLKELREKEKQIMVDISHGLQTPLTILKSELESLRHHVKLPSLSALDKSVDDISKFIYDFLNLSKLETAQANFIWEKVNLSRLLSDTSEYFSTLAEAKHINVVVNIQPDIFVTGDKNRLEELVTNLLSNSVKYMHNGGEKKIVIALNKNRGPIELSVSDTGIGISSEDLPHIFDRFYRAKNGDDIHGTGLGLAICKTIAERHNGTITVESSPGFGTAFIVKF